MTDIGIIDYGYGNIRSVAEAFEFLGHNTCIIDTAQDAPETGHLVLPGVGAFAQAAKTLRTRGFGDLIENHIAQEKPFLGICVGMQVLMEEGDEFGVHPGLGLVKGRTVHLSGKAAPNFQCPHIGWSRVTLKPHSVFAGSGLDGEYFYFNHSYICDPTDEQHTTAVPAESRPWTIILESGPVIGIQCHPEKSHLAGLKFLEAFAGL